MNLHADTTVLPEIDARLPAKDCNGCMLKSKATDLACRVQYEAPGALVFFVGGENEDCQYQLVSIFDDFNPVPVGRRLSELLVEAPPSKRAMVVTDFMRHTCMKPPVLLLDLGILFDPGLDIEPMQTLVAAAKGRVVFAEWPGTFDTETQTLIYAEAKDPAYKKYPLNGLCAAIDFSGNIYPRELNQGTQQ